MIHSVSMITPMAMACSKTRNRISFCDVWPDPPIIMLMRPMSSTSATAPIATGTAIWDMKSAMVGNCICPLVPAKAGTQQPCLDSRLRGNERLLGRRDNAKGSPP